MRSLSTQLPNPPYSGREWERWGRSSASSTRQANRKTSSLFLPPDILGRVTAWDKYNNKGISKIGIHANDIYSHAIPENSKLIADKIAGALLR